MPSRAQWEGVGVVFGEDGWPVLSGLWRRGVFRGEAVVSLGDGGAAQVEASCHDVRVYRCEQRGGGLATYRAPNSVVLACMAEADPEVTP